MNIRVMVLAVIGFLSCGIQAQQIPTILVGSPIRQKPPILEEFLASLERLPQQHYRLHFYFIDDNEDQVSRDLLAAFAARHSDCCTIALPQEGQSDTPYRCTEETHAWNETLIWKVAAFKDRMISHARDTHYDFLFLIDSDLVLHLRTIDQLLAANKDIIATIFWTRWQADAPELPQVWLSDTYTLYRSGISEHISEQEKQRRTQEFLSQLRVPGVYRVGGLGACTLISRNALEAGVSFSKIDNLSLWGEDRHFCVRALALGLQLYVDTHYPAYHIYRESALPGVAFFKHQCAVSVLAHPRITLSMVVKNEADRYLTEVLAAARTYITDAVIIDDGSTDDTIAVCERMLAGIPLYLVRNDQSKFSNEVALRKQQWDMTIATNPDWILSLDADEMFEEQFAAHVKELVHNPAVDAYYFRLYDFWNATQYRDDALWCAHHYYRPFLIRYRPQEAPYTWYEAAQHCGRFPVDISHLPYQLSSLRLQHFGWAREADRIAKYDRYKRLDPDGRWGSSAHYESILDESPRLVDWHEHEL